MIIIGDFGGTHTRIAASDTPDSFEKPVVFDTPHTPDAAARAFADAVADVSRGRTAEMAVVGAAGLFSLDDTTILRAPHLRAWEDAALADLFSNATGLRVHTKNDAMLGALGEAHFGAGKEASVLAYVTVGTGVGGARIVGGRIDRSPHGFEIGHQRLGTTIDAPELESLVSGSGLEARYGKPAAEIDDLAVWNECADYLAVGLYNTILHWSPDRVVLGGSAFLRARAIPLARIEETLRTIATAIEALPEFRIAELGDKAGLYGALAYAQMLTRA